MELKTQDPDKNMSEDCGQQVATHKYSVAHEAIKLLSLTATASSLHTKQAIRYRNGCISCSRGRCSLLTSESFPNLAIRIRHTEWGGRYTCVSGGLRQLVHIVRGMTAVAIEGPSAREAMNRYAPYGLRQVLHDGSETALGQKPVEHTS